jgi:predicted dehydrogenase
MRKNGISRRKFIAGTAAGFATVMVLPRSVWGANGKLNVACIGCGGKGDSDSNDVGGENVVAICDTDQNQLNNKAKKYANAKQYRDFRKMLDEMDKEIEAVTVSTPDHTHFPAAMCAIMHGKHAFSQKPLTHNIWEARRLAQAVKEKNLSSQMGIQGHANEAARLVCEWTWAGLLGDVTEVHYWTNRPVWPQGIGRPKDSPPVPSNLDWNLWLTSAPLRPYNGAYCPFKWRGWWDYGCGAIGDIACHVMDAGFWALDLRYPSAVSAECSGINEETFPKWSIITLEYPARGKLAPVKVIWHDGGKMPTMPKEMEGKEPNKECGAIFYGTKAVLTHDFYCGSCRIIPEAKHKELQPTKVPKTLPRAAPGGTMGEYIKGCKNNGDAKGANFQYAAALTEMAHLGNLALRAGPGKKVEWDPKTMKVTNLPELNKYIKREPRKEYAEFYKGDDVLPMPTPTNLGGMA